jgi:hypothetical protein
VAKKLTTSERIKQDKPLQIFENERAGWKWKIWKFYKAPGKPLQAQIDATLADTYGRAFVGAKSPFTYGSYELGDSYYREIVQNAVLTYQEGESNASIGSM